MTSIRNMSSRHRLGFVVIMISHNIGWEQIFAPWQDSKLNYFLQFIYFNDTKLRLQR